MRATAWVCAWAPANASRSTTPDGTRGPGAKEDVENPAAALAAVKVRAAGRQLTAEERAKLVGKGDPTENPRSKRKKKANE